MAKRQLSVLQRKRRLTSGDKAVRCKFHTLRRAGAEIQRIILKPQPVFQRHVDARMTAEGKVHALFVPVFHTDLRMQCVFFQPIANCVAEAERILRVKFRIRLNLQRNGVIRFLRRSKLRRGRKAMNRKMVRLPFVAIYPVCQPRHIRKNRRRAVGPVGGVSLPEIFGLPGQMHQLRTERRNLRLHAAAADGIKHGKASCRVLLVFSF